jgi:FMN reductase
MRAAAVPLVVGIGGTLRAGSSSERALRVALAGAGMASARTELLVAGELELPMYAPERPDRAPAALRLLDALRRADGIVIASPGYHAGPSGLIKNALDYSEDMREDPRPYFDGVPVGCIACAAGWQAAGMTLTALRAVVHALRGWPTPLGVTVNSGLESVEDEHVAAKLRLLGAQVADGARLRLSAGRAVGA